MNLNNLLSSNIMSSHSHSKASIHNFTNKTEIPSFTQLRMIAICVLVLCLAFTLVPLVAVFFYHDDFIRTFTKLENSSNTWSNSIFGIFLHIIPSFIYFTFPTCMASLCSSFVGFCFAYIGFHYIGWLE